MLPTILTYQITKQSHNFYNSDLQIKIETKNRAIINGETISITTIRPPQHRQGIKMLSPSYIPSIGIKLFSPPARARKKGKDH